MSTSVLFALQNQLKSQLKKRFTTENGEKLFRALLPEFFHQNTIESVDDHYKVIKFQMWH